MANWTLAELPSTERAYWITLPTSQVLGNLLNQPAKTWLCFQSTSPLAYLLST